MSRAVKIKDGRFIGTIDRDIFTKCVRGSKHKLLEPEAWCIDAEAFDKYIRPAGVNLIRIVDLENYRRYDVGIGTFIKECGEIDHKHGRQYFLIMKHWKVW